jgi:hypothetical protein
MRCSADAITNRNAIFRFGEHKKSLRSTLLPAARYWLKEAQQKFNAELAHARQTLAAENFDDTEVQQAPKVRAAKLRVEKFDRLVASIESSADEHLWQNAAQILE